MSTFTTYQAPYTRLTALNTLAKIYIDTVPTKPCFDEFWQVHSEELGEKAKSSARVCFERQMRIRSEARTTTDVLG